MKTITIQPKIIQHNWYIIDAQGKTLGRLATELARRLQGKHKTEYTPHIDIGDYFIILNSEKISVTGNKYNKKIYYHHTGYSGGIKQRTFREVLLNHPNWIIEHAVKGMLPKGPLGRIIFRKLKVCIGSFHKYSAQKPQILDI